MNKVRGKNINEKRKIEINQIGKVLFLNFLLQHLYYSVSFSLQSSFIAITVEDS